MRSNSNAPRNLRLLFRLVWTGICTLASGRRTAAGRPHSPTRKRTDERTVFSPWHSLHLSPRAGKLSASIIFPTRNVSVAMAFDRSFPQSLASPTSPPPSIAVHGSCLPVNSDRYGLRVERLFLPARLCFPDTVTQKRCRSLRLHLHSQTLFDDSASLLCQPETSACFSEPSMPGCFTPSYISRSAFSAALGIVKQACLCSRWHENSHGSHTNGHILPTHRGRSRQHSTPSAVFYYPSATLTPPQADVRCAA